jgi:hypothetical protein
MSTEPQRDAIHFEPSRKLVRRCLVRSILLVLLWCGVATANGRFPRAQRVVQDPMDGNVIAIYGTYGLLITTDGGQNWQHVCEGATGPFAGEDPLLELLPEGRLLMGTDLGLASSQFPPCDWQLSLEPAMPGSVQDITRHPTEPSTVIALLSSNASGEYESSLRRSIDGGSIWQAPVALPNDRIVRGLTLDLAPSDPSRIYVSGFNDAGEGVLLRSEGASDAGADWQAFPIPETGLSAAPYIAAVDPLNPDRLFVRTDVLKDIDGVQTPEDALWYSGDGGNSWTNVIRRRAKLLGFALSPDNQFLLAAYGDPLLFGYLVATDQMGIYRIPIADLLADPANAEAKFEKIYPGNVTCLKWNANGLFACVVQTLVGFELGQASDASFTLETPQPFSPLLDLTRVLPLSCPNDAKAAACLNDLNTGWPSVCLRLGADCYYGMPSNDLDAGPRDASPPSNAAEAGTNIEAGTAESKPRSAGCGCRVHERAPSRLSLALALIWGAAALWRRSHNSQ